MKWSIQSFSTFTNNKILIYGSPGNKSDRRRTAAVEVGVGASSTPAQPSLCPPPEQPWRHLCETLRAPLNAAWGHCLSLAPLAYDEGAYYESRDGRDFLRVTARVLLPLEYSLPYETGPVRASLKQLSPAAICPTMGKGTLGATHTFPCVLGNAFLKHPMGGENLEFTLLPKTRPLLVS